MDDLQNPGRRAFWRGRTQHSAPATPVPGPSSAPSAPAPTGPQVARIGEACLARRGIECRVCGEACEVSAIRFRPVRGSVVQPVLSEESCTGCADCLAVCPVGALQLFDGEST